MIPLRHHSSHDVIAEDTGYWGTLSDDQWTLMSILFPACGETPVNHRLIVEAILWSLRHSALWSDLPVGFPHPDDIVRLLHEWCESEEAREALVHMANDWPGTRSRPLMSVLEIVRGPDLATAISVHTLNYVELSVRHLSTDLYAVLTPVDANSEGEN